VLCFCDFFCVERCWVFGFLACVLLFLLCWLCTLWFFFFGVAPRNYLCGIFLIAFWKGSLLSSLSPFFFSLVDARFVAFFPLRMRSNFLHLPVRSGAVAKILFPLRPSRTAGALFLSGKGFAFFFFPLSSTQQVGSFSFQWIGVFTPATNMSV